MFCTTLLPHRLNAYQCSLLTAHRSHRLKSMFITTPCPQCGGEVEYLDEAQAIQCAYCGSLLHLVGTDEDRRYYMEPRADEEKIKKALALGFKKKKGIDIRFVGSRLVFFPYWWVKGMVFKWMLGRDANGEYVKKMKTRLLDHTFPAHTDIPIGPPTLGVRTSTMRVRAFNNEEMKKWGEPFKVTISHAAAVDYAEDIKDSTLSLGDGVFTEMEKSGLIGERYSLIYFPVWAFEVETPQGKAELFVDGISLSVIRMPQKTGPVMPALTDDVFAFEFKDVGFIPLKCPECGWDLPFHAYNVIHLCTTCGRSWRERRGTFQEVSYDVVKEQGERGDLFAYLPFWRFTVSLTAESTKITNMADFYRYLPMPRVMDWEKEEKKPIRFFIPAFRIKNIPVVSKFSTMLTSNQPVFSFTDKEVFIKSDVGDVFLSAQEAREMAELVLYALVPKGSRKAKEFVQQARMDVLEEQLAWLPFLEKGISYVEQTTGYALQKNAVEIH